MPASIANWSQGTYTLLNLWEYKKYIAWKMHPFKLKKNKICLKLLIDKCCQVEGELRVYLWVYIYIYMNVCAYMYTHICSQSIILSQYHIILYYFFVVVFQNCRGQGRKVPESLGHQKKLLYRIWREERKGGYVIKL